MFKGYKYRIYPTSQQAELINKSTGACRFLYNLALETKNYAYSSHRKNLSVFELMKQIVGLYEECPWLREVDSQSLRQVLLDLDKAFNEFFKGTSEFPSFKKGRKTNQSFRNPQGKYTFIRNDKLFQPKFRDGIKIVIDRPHEGIIRSSTISRAPSGKYFAAVLCEIKTPEPNKSPIVNDKALGIDLGLKSFIVTSDGEKVDNPLYLRRSIARIKVLSSRMRNKKKGSKNQKKAYLKIALVHERVGNQRKDFLQKLSTKLIRENQTVCLEDLNIEGMLNHRNLAGTIGDSGWGMFVRMCKYKSDWNGVNFLQIPRFEPSSKICSNCGATNRKLTLSIRSWTCICGINHDRDINAAINIKNYCIRHSGEGISSVPVELPTLVGTVKQERFIPIP